MTQTYNELHSADTRRARWPWDVVPLVSAVVIVALTFLNFFALLLAPVSLLIALVLFFRSGRRGLLLGLGLALNLLLNTWIVAVIVNLIVNGR